MDSHCCRLSAERRVLSTTLHHLLLLLLHEYYAIVHILNLCISSVRDNSAKLAMMHIYF